MEPDYLGVAFGLLSPLGSPVASGVVGELPDFESIYFAAAGGGFVDFVSSGLVG